MKTKSIQFWLLVAALIFCPFTVKAGPSHKPLPPLKISISTTMPGLTPDQINPGDTVALQVMASSAIDAPEMQIDVKLSGGAQLISGDTSWKGSAVKGVNTVINLTVHAPRKGTGKVTARVSLPAQKGSVFAAEARFVLGKEAQNESGKGPAIKKDSRGRSVREYR